MQPAEKTICEVGLQTGTRLTLSVPTKAKDSGDLSLFSTFETAVDREIFIIVAPLYNSDLYPLHKDDLIKVAYVTKSAFFETDAVVVDRFRKGDLAFLRVKCIAGVRRNQRRNDFRVDVLLETVLAKTDPEDPTIAVASDEPLRILIVNLSAGGAALYCTADVTPGDFIHIKLPAEILEEGRIVISQVHWVRKPDRDVPYKQYIGVRFIIDNNRDKEVLVKYTFDRQRQQLKR